MPVMQAAKLTPGGFYAHFEDKDSLLAEVLGHCILRNNRRLAAESTIEPGSYVEWIDYYLSRGHLDSPGDGCPLPSLTAEIARQPTKVRRAFTDAMRVRLSELARATPGQSDEERSRRSIVVLAALMGAVTLARALDDVKFRDRVLAVVREAVLAEIESSPKQSHAERGRSEAVDTGSTKAKSSGKKSRLPKAAAK